MEHPYVRTKTLEPKTGKSSGSISFTLPFHEWYRINVPYTAISTGGIYEVLNFRYAMNGNIPTYNELLFSFGAFRTDGSTSVSVNCTVKLEVSGILTDAVT
jgi:hypothetical protein